MIGGGFAGLAAAAELSSHKTIQVTLVEAADYLGILFVFITVVFMSLICAY